jgi:hypothetical protein
MQEGYGAREAAPPVADEDPVVAFLFGEGAGSSRTTQPAPRFESAASRSISRLRNNRGALYLPTLGRPARMVRQW